MLETVKNILSYSFSVANYTFAVSNVIQFLLILIVARVLIWMIDKFFFDKVYARQNVPIGRQHAAKQLVKYFIYTIALVLAVQSLGINITILLAGSAALFVGVGIGLQQTFNDLVSGLLLLFEDVVKVGDVVEVDTMIGRVQHIGIRTSQIRTRENISVIVPNSKIVVNNVINWSHQNPTSRFRLSVGVAYGSDVKKVERVLLETAYEHVDVKKTPPPRVLFRDFGNSSLDFELFFASEKLMDIEFVKSDLRFTIDQKFRENDISIPFPQRDLHIKSGILNIQPAKEEELLQGKPKTPKDTNSDGDFE